MTIKATYTATASYAIDSSMSVTTTSTVTCISECRNACDISGTCKTWEFNAGTCTQSACSAVQLLAASSRVTYSKGVKYFIISVADLIFSYFVMKYHNSLMNI